MAHHAKSGIYLAVCTKMTKSNQESQPATNQKLQAKGFASYVPVVATCMVLCGVPAAMMMSCGGIFYHVIAADLGVCNTALLSLSTPTIINRWFAKNVGLLVGICFAFTGVGGVIFIAVGQAVGKVGLGFMGDLSVKKSIALACSTGILGTLFCWLGAQTVLLPVGGFFYAAAMVFSPLLVRSVFGSGKHYGITYSRIYVSVSLFSAIGQVIWPFLADNAGGFDTVFAVALVLIMVIAALGLAANSYAGKLPQE